MEADAFGDDVPIDFCVTQMTPEKFNGTKYMIWSSRVELFLGCYGLTDHLTSDEPAAASDDDDDPRAQSWKQKDAQVKCMMLNSVESDIRSILLYMSTAKEMWLYLRHIYWGNGDLFHKYEVCKRYFSLKQGNQSVDEYYSQFNWVEYEMDLLFPKSSDVSVMEKRRNDIHVFRFFYGLRDEFEPFIDGILRGTELPTLPKACNIIRQGESLLNYRRSNNSNLLDNNTAQGRGRGGRGRRGGRNSR